MSLKEKLDQDYISAYKSHETMKVSVLRMVKSSIKNAEIDLGHPLSDAEVVKLLRKEKKQREEAINEYEKGNREDLISDSREEIEIIETYLPAQIDASIIQKTVDETIGELNASGAKDIGRVIGIVMKKLGANADGSAVASIVKNSLTTNK